jgi:hypothetical protein
VRPKGATRPRATWRASMGVCSRKAVWGKSRQSGDAKDSRQWRPGCSEKMAQLVGDGVDEGLKKQMLNGRRKAPKAKKRGKSTRKLSRTREPKNPRTQEPKNSRTRELENSRTRELKNPNPQERKNARTQERKNARTLLKKSA